MGIKRRFKIKKQQRWKRRKARKKLAEKSPQVIQQPASGETPVPPAETSNKTS